MCYRKRKKSVRKKADLQKIREERLGVQISEHYIYNSLQCIAALCDDDPVIAKKATIAFADYLRLNLEDLTAKELIPFDRELEHTQHFLTLEKLTGVRNFEVDYNFGITDFMMPPFVLQPLVENAVKYGSGADGKKNRIVISTFKKHGRIVIEVTNDLAGTYQSRNREIHKNGVGIENIRARLKKHGGTLIMVVSGDKVKVTVTI